MVVSPTSSSLERELCKVGRTGLVDLGQRPGSGFDDPGELIDGEEPVVKPPCGDIAEPNANPQLPTRSTSRTVPLEVCQVERVVRRMRVFPCPSRIAPGAARFASLRKVAAAESGPAISARLLPSITMV